MGEISFWHFQTIWVRIFFLNLIHKKISVAPITKIVPLFLWSAKMPKIYAKCQKFMQKLWNFIFCHLNIVRAVYKLSFKLLVRSVAHITKIVPPFLWFRGGLCYKHRRIRPGVLLCQQTDTLMGQVSQEESSCLKAHLCFRLHCKLIQFRLSPCSTYWDR